VCAQFVTARLTYGEAAGLCGWHPAVIQALADCVDAELGWVPVAELRGWLAASNALFAMTANDDLIVLTTPQGLSGCEDLLEGIAEFMGVGDADDQLQNEPHLLGMVSLCMQGLDEESGQVSVRVEEAGRRLWQISTYDTEHDTERRVLDLSNPTARFVRDLRVVFDRQGTELFRARGSVSQYDLLTYQDHYVDWHEETSTFRRSS
jgi:hypothetical protein